MFDPKKPSMSNLKNDKLGLNIMQQKGLEYVKKYSSIDIRIYASINNVSNKTAFLDLLESKFNWYLKQKLDFDHFIVKLEVLLNKKVNIQ